MYIVQRHVHTYWEDCSGKLSLDDAYELMNDMMHAQPGIKFKLTEINPYTGRRCN
jgi:hypothetical protein